MIVMHILVTMYYADYSVVVIVIIYYYAISIIYILQKAFYETKETFELCILINKKGYSIIHNNTMMRKRYLCTHYMVKYNFHTSSIFIILRFMVQYIVYCIVEHFKKKPPIVRAMIVLEGSRI